MAKLQSQSAAPMAEGPGPKIKEPEAIPPAAPGMIDVREISEKTPTGKIPEPPEEVMTLGEAARRDPNIEVSSPSLVMTGGDGPGKYKVSLNCPTPLAHREMEIEAKNSGDARNKFLQANGISDSQHTFKIQKI